MILPAGSSDAARAAHVAGRVVNGVAPRAAFHHVKIGQVGIVQAAGPFPNVAAHIHTAVGRDILRNGTNRQRIAIAPIPARPRPFAARLDEQTKQKSCWLHRKRRLPLNFGTRFLVAPGIETAVHPSRRLFPLKLRWQRDFYTQLFG